MLVSLLLGVILFVSIVIFVVGLAAFSRALLIEIRQALDHQIHCIEEILSFLELYYRDEA